MINPVTRGIENTFDSSGGLVWSHLHSEREDICAALLKEAAPGFADKRRELLQSRLRKIDDALDRLFSGSYGNCSKCGKRIEDVKLDADAATPFCKNCSNPEPGTDHGNSPNFNTTLEGVAINSLKPFDSIWVSTHNSDYRFIILDPKTGRVLVKGGRYFVEPVEAMISGSTFGSSILNNQWIGIGMRIEMWFEDKFIITSAVRAIRVEPNSAGELQVEPVNQLVA